MGTGSSSFRTLKRSPVLSWLTRLNKCGKNEGEITHSSLPLLLSLPLCAVCRYNELMFTIETCQAASMIHKFYSPNIVASGSSRIGEDALSVSIYKREREREREGGKREGKREGEREGERGREGEREGGRVPHVYYAVPPAPHGQCNRCPHHRPLDLLCSGVP